jgi:hypothetical protein
MYEFYVVLTYICGCSVFEIGPSEGRDAALFIVSSGKGENEIKA